MLLGISLLEAAFALSVTGLCAALPHNVDRRQPTASVVTHCTVPNTAALTFVSREIFRILNPQNV